MWERKRCVKSWKEIVTKETININDIFQFTLTIIFLFYWFFGNHCDIAYLMHITVQKHFYLTLLKWNPLLNELESHLHVAIPIRVDEGNQHSSILIQRRKVIGSNITRHKITQLYATATCNLLICRRSCYTFQDGHGCWRYHHVHSFAASYKLLNWNRHLSTHFILPCKSAFTVWIKKNAPSNMHLTRSSLLS